MAIVVDTNILMHNPIGLLKDVKEKLIIPSIVIEELDHLKMNTDNKKAFEARQGIRWLKANENRYEFVLNDVIKSEELINGEFDLSKNDNKILDVCLREKAKIFSLDYNVILKAKALGIKTIIKEEFRTEEYTGFKDVYLSDEEMSDMYENLDKNKWELFTNEYLIIKDKTGEVIDKLKWNGKELVQVEYKNMKSSMLGNLKPLDAYQMCVLDSFQNNQITMVKGKAGSGKSYLSMGFLFNQLEKGKIDRIIMFVNSLPVKNSSSLGYYPGTREEKICAGQAGNFLNSKLGDSLAVQMLLQQNKLVLLPMSDIRGYDTTSMRAGVYIQEAQNLDISMAKLALQRIGEDCICIIDGDYNTQVDNNNFAGENNGMRRMSEVFKGQDFYGEVKLNKIYRSKIAERADLM